jgi:hypothetical protein
MSSRTGLSLILGSVVFLSACGGAAPVASPTPSPSPAVTPAASPSPGGAVVVTFQVEDEQYRILLTDEADIENARRLLAGEEAPNIPNGLIVRGDPGVNVGYSWHIDPASVDFADMTMEICDGVPSFVEDGTLEGDRYCPWGARVIGIEPAQ